MHAQTNDDAFAKRVMEILNCGALALMISIGQQTKLFDTMELLPPSSSRQIADAADLVERYVREWLNAMVVGGIITYSAEDATYALPPSHASSLVRAAGIQNIAPKAQYIAALGNIEGDIIRCFRQGGGLSFSSHTRLQDLMAADSTAYFDAYLIRSILPLVPGLTERLASGIEVLEIGCGNGYALCLMAAEYPNSTFTGYDIAVEAITDAKRHAGRLGLSNVQFVLRDATNLTDRIRFDLVAAFNSIHDVSHPSAVLATVANTLRDDGTFLMCETQADSDVAGNLEHQLAPLLYTISTMYCITVSLAAEGDGLGTMWGEQLILQMLRQAGLTTITSKQLASDDFHRYYLASKG